ncbi:MAG: hypothetical protein ACYCST_15965 [Acidimicrobiales bacterium]
MKAPQSNIEIKGAFQTLTALTQTYPPAVGAAKSNVVHTRTRRFLDKTGSGVEIPIYSGNGIRGLLRRALAFDFAERLGLDPVETTPTLAHTLWVGGRINKDAAKGLTSKQVEAVRSLVPPIGLFGGCAQGVMIQGSVSTSDWIAQSRETPECCRGAGIDEAGLPGAASLVSEQGYVQNGNLLTEWFDQETLVSFGAAKKNIDVDEGGSALGLGMPYRVQEVSPGTTFCGSIVLHRWRHETDEMAAVRSSALRLAIETVLPEHGWCSLGLGRLKGSGQVDVSWGNLSDLGDGDEYASFVAENREAILAQLKAIEGPGPKKPLTPEEKAERAAKAEAKAKAAEEALVAVGAAANGTSGHD